MVGPSATAVTARTHGQRFSPGLVPRSGNLANLARIDDRSDRARIASTKDTAGGVDSIELLLATRWI